MAGTAASGRRSRFAPYGLLSPGVIWLALFFLVPVAFLFRTSLSEKSGRFDLNPDFNWHWSNYTDSLSDFTDQFIRGFGYAAVATILALLIGYPLAYVIAFRGGRWKNLLLGLVVVPLFATFLVRTFAWKTIVADEGLLVGVLRDVGILGASGRLDATPIAVIGGLTYNFLPFMVLPIYVALERLDFSLIDAAKDLYSSASRAFFKIVLPLSLPGVFAGSLLTFIPASGDYVNAELLGGPNTTMTGNVVYNQFIGQNNYPTAAAISIMLMVVITIAVLVYSKVLGTEDLVG
ncbi:MAG: ABC transporter permease [Acidimicrobiia bacterium]